MTLTLHARKNGIVAKRFLLEAHFLQTSVAVHQVADNNHVLYREGPVTVFLFARLSLPILFVVVAALVHLAVLFGPGHRFFKFLLVIDAKLYPT